ncbi:hypothetical protein YC2023_024001 [Brassica napus]
MVMKKTIHSKGINWSEQQNQSQEKVSKTLAQKIGTSIVRAIAPSKVRVYAVVNIIVICDYDFLAVQ